MWRLPERERQLQTADVDRDREAAWTGIESGGVRGQGAIDKVPHLANVGESGWCSTRTGHLTINIFLLRFHRKPGISYKPGCRSALFS